jgi:hypothetical protein
MQDYDPTRNLKQIPLVVLLHRPSLSQTNTLNSNPSIPPDNLLPILSYPSNTIPAPSIILMNSCAVKPRVPSSSELGISTQRDLRVPLCACTKALTTLSRRGPRPYPLIPWNSAAFLIGLLSKRLTTRGVSPLPVTVVGTSVRSTRRARERKGGVELIEVLRP